MKLSTRLIGSFIIVIAWVIFIGLFSQAKISDLYSNVSELTTIKLPAIRGIGKFEKQINEFRKIEFMYLVSENKDDLRNYEERMRKTSVNIESLFKEYASTMTQPEEKENYPKLVDAWKRYLSANEKILALTKNNEDHAAKSILFGDSRKQFYEVEKYADILGESSAKGGERSASDAFAAYTTGSRLIWIAICLAFITACGLAVWLIRNILKQLGEDPEYLKEVAQLMAQGDFNIKLKPAVNKDSVYGAFTVMASELINKINYSNGILHGVEIPFSVFSNEDLTVFTNKHMLDLLEIPGNPEDYYGQTSGEYLLNDKNKQTVTTLALREMRKIERDSEVTTRKGQKRHVHIISTPYFDSSHKVLGSISIWLDQTEIVNAKNVAEHAKEEGMLQAAQRLEGVVQIVSSASEKLSAQIEQSSRGADDQSGRVRETATAMEEMNATVLEVARNAQQAADVSHQARQQAQEGSKIVTDAVKSIEAVHAQSIAIKEDMDVLGKQAEGIGQIMGVIADIADQTNLLALNAAIEAARAGDAGRGFAVVADEVRKLAEKTMIATQEVGQAITGIQEGTRKNIRNVEQSGVSIEEAAKLSAQSGESLKQILEFVHMVNDQVQSIATASEQQSAASEEINHSVEQVATISVETAQAMEQASSAVAELAQQSQALQRLIVEMKNG